jgi:hypothetical protein
MLLPVLKLKLKLKLKLLLKVNMLKVIKSIL